MTLRRKFGFGIAGAVLATILYGAVLQAWSFEAEIEMRRAQLSSWQLEAILHLTSNVTQYVKEATALSALTKTDPAALRRAEEKMASSLARLAQLLDEEKAIADGEPDVLDEAALLTSLSGRIDLLKTAGRMAMGAGGQSPGERERLSWNVNKVFDEDLVSMLANWVDREQREVEQGAAEVKRASRFARIAAAVAPVALAMVLLALAVLVGRPASRTLDALLEGTRRVAVGDLEWRVPVRGGRGADELNALGAAFNQMVLDLRNTTVSKQFVDDIVRSMGDGLFVIDATGSLRLVNDAACALLRRASTALEGRAAAEVIHLAAGDRPLTVADLAKTPPEGRIELDLLIRTPGGESIPLRASCTAFREPRGESSYVVVTRDLREALRLAASEGAARETRRYNERLEETVRARTAELESSRNELAERLRQLEEAHARLRAADRLAAIGTLVAGVAHEINNPLTYLASNLRFVASELEAVRSAGRWATAEAIDEARRALGEAQDGVTRIAAIVNDLRTFSRVDERQVMPTSVQGALEAALTMARSELRHRARLVRDFEPVPPVCCSEARLVQVFLNIIINGAQAMAPDDIERNALRVSTRAGPDGQVVVEIQDTGQGIPEEIRERIFDPFFTTKPVGRGTGLGLSICHGIVKAQGGEITVESELGRGTTFRIVLPGTTELEVPAAAPAPEPIRSGGRLLVVDDEPFIGTSLQRLLGREHVVVALQDAVEALQLIESGQEFDLILCDLMMPKIGGMAFQQALTSSAPAQAERLVFITGGQLPPDAQQLLEKQPGRCIAKPFDPDQVRRLISKRLAERERAG